MITYETFYEIACYANENWNKGNASAKEIACDAYEFLVGFEESCKAGEPQGCLKALLDNLEEDITVDQVWLWISVINDEIIRRKNEKIIDRKTAGRSKKEP